MLTTLTKLYRLPQHLSIWRRCMTKNKTKTKSRRDEKCQRQVIWRWCFNKVTVEKATENHSTIRSKINHGCTQNKYNRTETALKEFPSLRLTPHPVRRNMRDPPTICNKEKIVIGIWNVRILYQYGMVESFKLKIEKLSINILCVYKIRWINNGDFINDNQESMCRRSEK